MKIATIIALLFLCIKINFAQVKTKDQPKEQPKSSIVTNFKFGKVDPESKNETLKNIFYDDGTNIYAVTTKNPAKYGIISLKVKPVIIKYNSQLEPSARLEIDPNEGNEIYIGAYQFSGSMFFLKTRFNKDSKKLEVVIKKFSPELKWEGSDIIVSNIEGIIYKEPKIKLEFSPQKDKCCLILEPDQKASEKKEIFMLVFDNKFSSLFEKKVSYDKKNELVKLMNISVTDKGDVFVLNKVYDSKEKEESPDKSPAYAYTLKKFNGTSEKECSLPKTDKFIEATCLSNKREVLKLVMTFGDKLDGGILGVKYFEFNSENCSEINHSDIKFENDIIFKMNLSDDTHKKGGSFASFFLPKYDPESIGVYYSITIVESPADGPTYLTLQRDLHRGNSTKNLIELKEPNFAYLNKGSYAMGTAEELYFSHGIIVMKIVSSQVKWQRAIPKMQFFRDYSGYLFHVTMFNKNKLCILYNDEKENEHYNIENPKSAPKEFNNLKVVYLMMVEFDEDGNVIRSTLGNTAKLGTNVNIELSKQTAPDRVVVNGFSMDGMGGNRKSQMGIATFQ